MEPVVIPATIGVSVWKRESLKIAAPAKARGRHSPSMDGRRWKLRESRCTFLGGAGKRARLSSPVFILTRKRGADK